MFDRNCRLDKLYSLRIRGFNHEKSREKENRGEAIEELDIYSLPDKSRQIIKRARERKRRGRGERQSEGSGICVLYNTPRQLHR